MLTHLTALYPVSVKCIQLQLFKTLYSVTVSTTPISPDLPFFSLLPTDFSVSHYAHRSHHFPAQTGLFSDVRKGQLPRPAAPQPSLGGASPSVSQPQGGPAGPRAMSLGQV